LRKLTQQANFPCSLRPPDYVEGDTALHMLGGGFAAKRVTLKILPLAR